MPELPDWQPLEQVVAPALRGPEGRVVVIVASEGAVASGWAEHAAVTLAETWTSSGHKVMLVDGGLQQPSLHSVAGVKNAEGLSDATLFGASVGRVAHQVDGGYFLITAGTPVADTNTVVQSPRWDRLARGFVEAGVTLTIFVRDGESGAKAFLDSASEIVVLAVPGEAPPSAVHDVEPLVRVVTGLGKSPGVGSADRASPLSASALKETASAGKPRLVALAVLAVVLAVVLAAAFGIIPIPGFAG